MSIYRGKKQHRPAHPKIYVWSHTKKAEIEYFQDFKNHLQTSLLMPQKNILWTPQQLIEEIIKWKTINIHEDDGDQVWCIFDIDDFYKKEKDNLMTAVQNAIKNNIKIAYTNECFELWILLHFQKPTSAIIRGVSIEKKINTNFKKYKLGRFIKNQKVFDALLPFQNIAIRNAKSILPEYNRINWNKMMSEKGNPSTSVHFLVGEINKLFGKK